MRSIGVLLGVVVARSCAADPVLDVDTSACSYAPPVAAGVDLLRVPVRVDEVVRRVEYGTVVDLHAVEEGHSRVVAEGWVLVGLGRPDHGLATAWLASDRQASCEAWTEDPTLVLHSRGLGGPGDRALAVEFVGRAPRPSPWCRRPSRPNGCPKLVDERGDCWW